ncbi:PREDICTED: putative exonuclease GOR [Bactrocera latifrons]|uniref:putative exonuclease GOR n=1 Tax=Bactrocera latifrons TaxID=174628 RepID=UPI0008DE1F58|nr:PREDICTED: putative exonuclease GOR [Bactrocera latifrons]
MPQEMRQNGQTRSRHSNPYNPHRSALQMCGQQVEPTVPKQNQRLSLQLPQFLKELRILQVQVAHQQSQMTGAKSDEKPPQKQAKCDKKKPLAVRKTIHIAATNPQVVASPLGDRYWLKISQSELIANLRRYIIAPNLLPIYGYPFDSTIYNGKVVIYKKLAPPFYTKSTSKPNAPNNDDNVNPTDLDRQHMPNNDEDLKQCVRCERPFRVTSSGDYLTRERCTFHKGKLRRVYTQNKKYNLQYTCCGASRESMGCASNPVHVWTGVVSGLNGPYSGFVHTRQITDDPKVYALDCEMFHTARGLALTKVTVIGFDGQLVYQNFVRPTSNVVDHNRRFSGVTDRDVSKSNKTVKTIGEVQLDLLQLIDANSILIGHGLENDLRVLQIVHKTVVDTSIVFPHSNGFPYRHSLKYLVKKYLKRNIQLEGKSHDTLEDTLACWELMLWKVATDKQER